MLTQKNFFGLVKSMAGSNDVIAVNMTLVRFTGSWPAGIILSQLLYWTDRTRIPGGWICKSHGDWFHEVFLSEHNCREARRRLETEMQIVEVIQKKFEGTPKPHYRILEDAFIRAFVAFLDSRKSRPSEILTDVRHNSEHSMDCQENRGTITETTETYTETTSYTKAPQVSDFLFPDLNIEPTEKKEKENPTPVAGGPSKKKKKVDPIPWSKSIFADLNYFIRFFEGTPYEQAKADFRHYHWAIRNWAVNAETGEDVQLKANWAATISNWIKKDYKDGRLVTTHDQSKASEKTGSQFERRASQAERVAEKLKLMREGETT